MHFVKGASGFCFHVLSQPGYEVHPIGERTGKGFLGMYPLSHKSVPYSFATKCLNLVAFMSQILPLVTIRSMIPSISMVMI